MSLNASENVLAYWQWFASLEKLRNLEHSCQMASMDCNQAEPKLEGSEVLGDAWICPFMIEHQGELLPLIWMPVTIQEDGLVLPHPKIPLPYAHLQLFDPLSPYGALLGKQEIFDDQLKHLFAPFDELEVPKNWQDFYQKTCELFQHIQAEKYEKWQQQFKSKVAVVEAVTDLPSEGPLNQCLLTERKEVSVSPPEDNFLEGRLGGLCQASTPITSSEILPIVLQLLTLPENTVQGVQGSIKSSAHELSTTLIASLALEALTGQKKTRVVWVNSAPDKAFVDRCQRLNQEQALDRAQEILNEEAPKKQTVDKLIELFERQLREAQKMIQSLPYAQPDAERDYQSRKLKRASLQKQDEQLESEVASLSKILKKWHLSKRRSMMKKIWDYVLGNTQSIRISEFIAKHAKGFKIQPHLSLEESMTQAMRAKKVERTKIHRQLMHLSEAIAQAEGGLQTWNSLKEQHVELQASSNTWESARYVLGLFPTIFDLAILADQLQEEPFFELTIVHPNELADISTALAEWVIVQEGHDLNGYQVMPLLQNAKRAIVIGDPYLKKSQGVSHEMDYWLVQGCLGPMTEELLEDRHYSGDILSQSSLFHIVEPRSYYLHTDPSGIVPILPFRCHQVYAQPELIHYYQHHLDTQVLISARKGDGIKTLHVEGQMQSNWVNALEAQAVLGCLQRNVSSSTCVVTLSHQQKLNIKTLLKDLPYEVYVLDECPLNQFDHIVFSPVYTHTTQRPHVLDCGDTMIYRLMSCARESLIIVGDLRIFDPTTHSPTGHLAKQLFAQERHLSDCPVAYGHNIEEVQRGEPSVLLQTLLETSQKIEMTSKTVNAAGLASLLTYLQQNPDRSQALTIYVGTLAFGEKGYKDPDVQSLLAELASLGVTWYRVKNLHANVIKTEKHCYESALPWLVVHSCAKSSVVWQHQDSLALRLQILASTLKEARLLPLEMIVV